MKLLIERIVSDAEATGGLLSIDGAFQCFTLEDQRQAQKVAGETRIPAGEYRVDLRTGSPMSDAYAARYGAMHRGMLWLRDVPGFKWIYIHTGNTDDHTEGCVLVGLDGHFRADGLTIGNSRAAYRRIYPTLAEAAARGDLRCAVVEREGV